ncbi:hypothetical protein Bca4012_073730 [Brassica carinata]
MSGEEEENAVELKIGDEFLKAKCLMNCEVSLIFEHKVFEKSLQYVKRFSRYKNPDVVQQVREYPLSFFSFVRVYMPYDFDRILSRHQLTEFELCVLCNLCPKTAEEAVAMVPSLKTKGRAHSDEVIEKMLNDLSLVKRFE